MRPESCTIQYTSLPRMVFFFFLIQLKPPCQPVKADMRADAALQVYFSNILHSGPPPPRMVYLGYLGFYI